MDLLKQQQQTLGTNQVDPTALNLSRAIRMAETSQDGEYNRFVKEPDGSTSWGGYMWNKNNFHDWATQYGLDPNDTSQQNQDHLAYLKIKDLLDQGKPQSEIAAIWNGSRIQNGRNIPINPDYVEQVKNNYNQLTLGYNPKPFSQPPSGDKTLSELITTEQPKEEGIGQQLSNRLGQAGTALTNAAQGKINPLSGLIQAVGAGGGAIGDIVNAGLEVIPGVKNVEQALGGVVKNVAGTEIGKTVMGQVEQFRKDHPELADDIGAGVNIATAIPILRGLSLVKDLALSAGAQALRGIAIKGAEKDLTETVARTAGGRTFLAANKDAMKTVVENVIPEIEIENGRYVTAGANDTLDELIASIDDNELQPAIRKASTPQVDTRMPLETYRQRGIELATDELHDTATVDNMFNRIKAKYGDFPTLEQMNDAKRQVRRMIKKSAWGTPERNTNQIVYNALQTGIEDGANTLGLGDVNAINQKMAKLIKAQNALKYIEGKSVKSGILGEVGADVTAGAAVAGGEAVGTAFGMPMAGTYLGGMLGRTFGKSVKGILPSLRTKILESGTQIAKPTLGSAGKKTGGLIGAALTQKAIKNK